MELRSSMECYTKNNKTDYKKQLFLYFIKINMKKLHKDLFDVTDRTDFIFTDDEWWHFIVTWKLNRYITYCAFKNEYTKLYEKYSQNDWELSDFYYKLEKRLNKMGITIQAMEYATFDWLFRS